MKRIRRRDQDVRRPFLWSHPSIALPDPVHAGRQDRSARPHLRGIVSDCQRAGTRYRGWQELRPWPG